MAKEKTPNYTDAQVAAMIAVYVDRNGSISDVISEVFTVDGKQTKTVAQVRAKLVSLKVYRAADKQAEKVATADNGPSKKEMLAELASMGVDVKGLESASKDGLKTVKAIEAECAALAAQVAEAA